MKQPRSLLRVGFCVLLALTLLSLVAYICYPNITHAYTVDKLAVFKPKKNVTLNGIRIASTGMMPMDNHKSTELSQSNEEPRASDKVDSREIDTINEGQLAAGNLSLNSSKAVLTHVLDSSIVIFSAIRRTYTHLPAVYLNTWTKLWFVKQSPMNKFHCCFILDNGTFYSSPVIYREYGYTAPFVSGQYACSISNLTRSNHFVRLVTIVVVTTLGNYTAIDMMPVCKTTPLARYVTVQRPINVSEILANNQKGRSVKTNYVALDQHSLHLTNRTPSLSENVTFSFAICGKLAYGYIEPEFLISWFEYYKRLGVNKVVIFKHNLVPVTSRVLDYYVTSGLLELLPFDYPKYASKGARVRQVGEKTNQVWGDEQVVVFDCQERLREFKYVGVIDVDELIVPKRDKDLESLFEQLHKKYPYAASFSFDTQVHVMQWHAKNYSQNVAIARQPYFLPEFNRPKYVYMPSRVSPGSVTTHKLRHRLAPFALKRAPGDLVVLQHYRRQCRREWVLSNACYTAPRRFDNTVERVFVDQQFQNTVANVKSHLNKTKILKPAG